MDRRTDMTYTLRVYFILFVERTQDQTLVFYTHKSMSAYNM
jgi:hypothetical protein